MNDHDDSQGASPDEQRVLAGLARMRQAINRQRYPGRAWVQPPRRRAILLWAGGIGATAAAVLILAVVWTGREGPGRSETGPPQAAAAARQLPPAEASSVTLDVPHEIGIPPVDGVGLSVASASIPPAGNVPFESSADWAVPTMSLPPLH